MSIFLRHATRALLTILSALSATTCLLPATHADELIAILADRHEALYCLTDDDACSLRLPQEQIAPWLPVCPGCPPGVPQNWNAKSQNARRSN